MGLISEILLFQYCTTFTGLQFTVWVMILKALITFLHACLGIQTDDVLYVQPVDVQPVNRSTADVFMRWGLLGCGTKPVELSTLGDILLNPFPLHRMVRFRVTVGIARNWAEALYTSLASNQLLIIQKPFTES